MESPKSENQTILASPSPGGQNPSQSESKKDISGQEKSDSFTAEPAYQMSGPKFDSLGKDGWGRKFKQWFNKYGSSIILPIIAILILTGGIYLYATRSNEKTGNSEKTSDIKITDEELTLSETKEEMTSAIEETTTETEQKTAIEEIIPEPIKKEGVIIEKAIKGDGITHLARRALKDYLTDRPQDKEITKEHKIYIEDYLKDRIGSRPLEVEEEVSFEESLIQEAINASLELAPNQLKALEKYSASVLF